MVGQPRGSHASGRHSWRTALVVATGLGAGFLSGLFGVGGGLVIVPALMAVLGMDQRRASATSLAAIVLTAAVGTWSYAVHGQVSLAAAAFLVVGALVGAQLGTWLLHRLPLRILPWIFISFVVFVVVSQRLHAPVREAVLSLGPVQACGLVVVGLLAGIMSGLAGVGGGAVIVPGLELVVGLGDLMARGTSLLVMIPTALAGTVANIRRRVVDLRSGLLVGGAAALAAPAGTMVAARISPETGSVLFSLFLVAVVVSTLHKERRRLTRESGTGLSPG